VRRAPIIRTAIVAILAILAIVAAALAALVAAPGVPAASAASAPGPTATLTGHGFGHGRGMGQYGALGYAVDQGWTYHQILDHYYGGTVAGQAPAGQIMTVDMTSRDGQATIVAQEVGQMALPAGAGVTCAAGTPCAVMIHRNGTGTFAVYQGTACTGGPGGWKLTAASLPAPAVAVTATAGATDDRHQMLQLCENDGTRWLRGDIWAVDTGTTQATVNHVPLESYVRGVVPNESPSFWGSLGAGAGEQALLAQAVAARSYSVAESYATYAKSCDTTQCQVYGGRAFQSSDGSFHDLEGTSTFANSDKAVASTAGEVRVFTSSGGGSAGKIALTEFSSSTGGYTAGGTFPAVPDAGDSTSANPNHTWARQVSSSAIESAFGSGMGSLVSIDVTARNGLGDLGGRVTTLRLSFTGGTVTTTGNRFAGALGLLSNWFAVTVQPAPPAGPPAPAPLGYHVLTRDGTVAAFGGATSYGSLNAAAAGTTAVSMGETPAGYDVLAGDGGVYVFGAATWYGSLKGKGLNAAPFQLATTRDGHGYWIVAFDGGVFSYGDAAFHGSTGNLRLNKPIVGMAPTPDGGGYWLVAADGGIFSFGDAAFYGSTGSIHLNRPVVAMAATADGHGYWLVASDGGVFTFGDARYQGSLPAIHVSEPAVALARYGGGYLVATSPGHVYGFGATAAGGPATNGATSPTVALAGAVHG
jgi:SpoIID/LytB domain protein